MTKNKKDFTDLVNGLRDGSVTSVDYHTASLLLKKLGCKDVTRVKNREHRNSHRMPVDIWRHPDLQHEVALHHRDGARVVSLNEYLEDIRNLDPEDFEARLKPGYVRQAAHENWADSVGESRGGRMALE